MLKTWPLPRTAVCVLLVVTGGGGGGRGQDVLTIKTSTMTPLSATVSRVLADGGVVTNAFHSHYACAK